MSDMVNESVYEVLTFSKMLYMFYDGVQRYSNIAYYVLTVNIASTF